MPILVRTIPIVDIESIVSVEIDIQRVVGTVGKNVFYHLISPKIDMTTIL
ncbi:MAG: hypothetical protein ACD_37C00622G0004 [uncultured bacterium]|nr:MAG: hypothetical protein ACD_37C00622G0004 [uncultured bacterium]